MTKNDGKNEIEMPPMESADVSNKHLQNESRFTAQILSDAGVKDTLQQKLCSITSADALLVSERARPGVILVQSRVFRSRCVQSVV